RNRLREQGPPAIVIVERTPRALLASVGLPLNGANNRRLDAALDRLCRPVGKRNPVLADWKRLADGRVRLSVRGPWLKVPAQQGIAGLPLPLPLHSPTTLALYLFLHAVRTDDPNTADIDRERLYVRIGLTQQSSRRLAGILKRTVRSINQH